MYCRKCGVYNEDSASYCTSCGEQMVVSHPAPSPQGPSFDEMPAMRMLLPVGRSGWAIVAGYLGLFSFLLIFAPFAIVFSVLAIFDLKRNPKKCGMGRAVFGLVMGVLGTFGLLALMFSWWGSSVGKFN